MSLCDPGSDGLSSCRAIFFFVNFCHGSILEVFGGLHRQTTKEAVVSKQTPKLASSRHHRRFTPPRGPTWHRDFMWGHAYAAYPSTDTLQHRKPRSASSVRTSGVQSLRT